MTTTPNEGRLVKNDDGRAHLYALAAAIVPLLVTVGVFTPEVATLVLNIAAAAISLGGFVMASLNTPKGRRAK